MSRPIIGITVTCSHYVSDPEGFERLSVNRLYADCVAAAGGTPLLLPFQASVEDVIELIDGWLIPGGDDIDPSEYGAARHEKTKLESKDRYEFEKRLYAAAPRGLPILGICYGCQFINVVRGGKIAQHVPEIVGHDEHSGGGLHSYAIDLSTRLGRIIGADSASGKSYHHQAVKTPGELLKVSARSEEGIIEGLEDTSGRWIVGVQWHPERTPDSPESQAIFRSFIGQADEYKKGRTVCGTW